MHGFKMLELDCFVALDLKKYLHCKNSVGQMFPVGLFIQALSCFSVPGTEFSIYLTDCCGLYKNEKWIQLQKQLLYYSVKFTYGSNRIERSIHCQKKKKKQKRNFCEAHPPTAGQCFAMAASSLESSAFSLVSLGTICKKQSLLCCLEA